MLPRVQCEIVQYTDEEELSFTLTNVLLDTGAETSLISYENVPINFEKDIGPTINLANAIDNNFASTALRLRCSLRLQDEEIEISNCEFLILEKSSHMAFNAIIGMNILSKIQLRIGRSENIVQINKISKNSKTLEFDIKPKNNGIILMEDTYLHQRETHKWVHAQTWPRRGLTMTNLRTIPKLDDNHVIIEQSNFKNTWNLVQISNLAEQDVFIKKGSILAIETILSDDQRMLNNLVKIEDISPAEKITHKKELEVWEERRNKLVKENSVEKEIDEAIDKIPFEYRRNIREIIEHYQWNLARSTSDAGLSQKYLAELKLKGDKASFSPPYPVKADLIEKIESKLTEMQESGLLEETCSPYNSPVLFILKPNNTLRCVNNYSSGDDSINQRLIMPRFPTVTVRVLLQLVGNNIAKLKEDNDEIAFANIDLANAFYVLGLRESNRSITAFLYSRRQLQYTRMAQGLSSSPSIFAAFASKCFGNLSSPKDGYFIQNYQDDLIIISKKQSMAKAIKTIFKTVKDNNLIVRLNKCTFFKKEINFLGYTLDEEGIKVPDKRIKILRELPLPTTLRKAQQFQGAFMYYMRQTPELVALLTPLSKEIGKNKDYKLTEEIKTNLQKLQSSVKDGLGTCHLEYNSRTKNRKIFICADTSLKWSGGVIGNVTSTDGQLSDIKIAAYCSKSLSEQESMLASRARELIGIQMTIRAFKDMIPTTEEVLIFTDHKSLSGIVHNPGLKTSGSTRCRSAFAEILEIPNSKIFYVPATSDIIHVVDCLSRINIKDTEISAETFHPKSFKRGTTMEGVQVNNLKLKKKVPKVDYLEIIKAQLASEKFSKIHGKLQNDELISIDNGKYVKRKNGLYKMTIDGKELIVIPKDLGKNVLEIIHVKAAHIGVKGLMKLLESEDVWIEQKTKSTHEVIRACITCKLIYNKNERKIEDQKIKPSFEPFQRVYSDIVEIRTTTGIGINVITFQDQFSRKVIYRIAPNKESTTVAERLAEMIAEVGGQGQMSICTDNGGEFTGAATQNLLESLNVIHFKISPTNSRANLCERFHKELRRILQTTSYTAKTAKHKIDIAISMYNNKPNGALGNRTPNQVLSAISPPKYFSMSKPETTNAEQSPSYEDHLTDLLDLHGNIAKEHLRNFLIYPQVEQTNFKEGDVVVLKENSTIGHQRMNHGPFLVKKLRKNNGLELHNLRTGRPLHRHARFVAKIYLSNEEKEKLIQEDSIIFNPKTLEIGPKNIESVKCLLDFDFKTPQKEENRTNNKEKAEQKPENRRYNLRSRK